MKKKILGLASVILLVIMLFVLTGCSNNEEGLNSKSNNKKLSDIVKVGDYVDYKVESGKTYTSTSDKTGIDKDQIFETTGNEKWRVLSIEDDGSVNLVSAEGIRTKFEKKYSLYGENGYINGVEELDNISKIYATGKHAVSGRSLKTDDIIGLIDIDKLTQYYENKFETDLSIYNDNEKIEKIYKLMYDEYGNTYNIDGEEKIVDDALYYFGIMQIENIVNNPVVIDLLKSEKVWLADKRINKMKTSNLDFNYGISSYSVSNSSVSSDFNIIDFQTSTLFLVSDKYSFQKDNLVKPVIKMESNIEIENGSGTENEAYTLK